LGWWSQEWTVYFMKSNIVIAIFNLLPIYPLDGGRILQSVLSYWFPFRKCIQYVYWLSFLFSIGLILFSFCIPGVTMHPSLFIIGIFLFYSNLMSFKIQEYQFLRFLLHRLEHGISSTVPLYKICVSMDEHLPLIIKKWYRERHHVVEVIDHRGKVIGWLSEESVLQSYFKGKWYRMKELLP